MHSLLADPLFPIFAPAMLAIAGLAIWGIFEFARSLANIATDVATLAEERSQPTLPAPHRITRPRLVEAAE